MIKENLVGFNIRLPESRWLFLKQEAMNTKKSMSQILIEYIDTNKKKREKELTQDGTIV